jgi:cyclopropane-fatty-acyl-phospholipid synthase
MSKSISQRVIESILEPQDIHINGNRPWDMVVRDERVFRDIVTRGSLGLGNAYTQGWWDSPALDEWMYRVSQSPALRSARTLTHIIPNALATASEFLYNTQSLPRSQHVLKKHYELNLPLFANMLDPLMQYSCAHFGNTKTLPEAQVEKLDLIARKLEISERDTLLDIGSGWGGLAKYFSENKGCSVTGINISQKQIQFSEKFAPSQKVSFQNRDYRQIEGIFDKVVSVGMFEHVGPQNYRAFMKSAHKALRPGGLLLIQSITKSTSDKICDPWIKRNIFPNSHIPSLAQVSAAAEDLFVLESVQNIGEHYDKTLMCWHKNFTKNWEKISPSFDSAFQRKWTYYLLTCAGVFRARELGCCQVLFRKN